MYKIMCMFKDSNKLEDVFCDNPSLEKAKMIAYRWIAGVYCYSADAVREVVVVDSSGNVVYRKGR